MNKKKISLFDDDDPEGTVKLQKPVIDINTPCKKLCKSPEEILEEFKHDVSKDIKKAPVKKTRKKKVPPPAEYYTREEIAGIMNVPVSTVTRQIKENKIPGRQMFAHKWYIHRQTFYKWLLQKRQIEHRAFKKR